MPGYPAVVAICGGHIFWVRLLQCLLDTGTILAVYLLAASPALVHRPLGQTRVICALIAALLIAVNPFYIYFSGLILSETIFSSLTIWGMLLLARRRLLPATVVLVAACFVRPAMIFMAPILTGVAVVNHRPGRPYLLLPEIGRGIAAAMFVMAVMLAALFPWAWRNHHRFGSWVWTTTNGGVTLYDGFNPAATGASDQRFLAKIPGVCSMRELERSRFLSRSATVWAGHHLGELPMLSIRKVDRTWSPVPLSAEFGRPVYRVVSAAYAIPFDLLVLFGLFSKRLTGAAKLLVVTPAILITVLGILSVGSIRYRMPAEAPLAVLAAAGAIEIFRIATGKMFPRRAGAMKL
jgi:4-amino-4-deoxy-L-arabinose transferase-like glycosyltransferase